MTKNMLLIQDITDKNLLKAYVKQYISADIGSLDEDDLQTFRFPERRFMSVSFTDLRGFTAMSEELSPEEVRTVINAYLEVIIKTIDEEQGHSG